MNAVTDPEWAAGSSDEEEEVAPPAPSSGRPRGRRRRELKNKCFLVLYGGSGSYGRDRSVCDTIHAG